VPVYAGSLDDIVGVLHSKDMMRAMIPGATAMSIRQLMREPFFVPDTQRADELLRQFRRHRQYMAIVLDEYGGTAGVVTLDDLMSEIVGELDDAPSAATPDIQPLPDGGALVNGLTSLNTTNETLGLELSDDHFETVGGFMMSRLGRIPKAGDEVTLASGARLRVEEMDRLRVAKVRLIAASNPSPQI
jgi:CBS domain containing-hemolysin-like protein